jgi:membrane protease YdiL (CAAX protease family)
MAVPPAAERRAATALALVVAMALPTLITWLYFDLLAGQGPANGLQQATYLLGKTIQFTLPIGFVLWADPKTLWPIRLRFAGLRLALGFAWLVSAAMVIVYFSWLRDSSLFAGTTPAIRAKLAEVDLLSPLRYLGLALFLCVAHSLLEEYYWRWFVFGRLRALIPLWPAIVLSSLAFMAHHVLVLHHYFPGRFLHATLPFSLGVAVGGGVWAWIYQRTGSIGATWLSHFLIDATIFLIGWDLIFVRG